MQDVSMQEENGDILCVSNSYLQKYYLARPYRSLPKEVRDELQIMCVLFTEEIGGILSVSFDQEGNIHLTPFSSETDTGFDEIGCRLKLKQLLQEKRTLLQSLEDYYRQVIVPKRKEK